jgi:hypothetical protein
VTTLLWVALGAVVGLFLLLMAVRWLAKGLPIFDAWPDLPGERSPWEGESH